MTSLHVAASQSAPAAHTDAITSRMTHFSCGANLPRIDLLHRSVGLFGCSGINRVGLYMLLPIQTDETLIIQGLCAL